VEVVTFEESTRTIAVGGRQVHYNEAGSGPAFLGFHGGGPGANGWDNTKWNIDALSREHHVLLVDLPGYGDSEPMEALEGETQDAMYARFIGGLLDAKGIDKAALYGTSMSGGPVVRFAHEHPDRVIKLILKSPGTVGFGPNILSTSPPDGIMALGAFRENPTRENMVRMMNLFVPRPGLLADEMIDARYQSALKAMAMPQPKNGPAGMSDLRPVLPELKVPVLVFWGHQDRMVPLDGALMMLALIPDVRVVLWGGGTGHFVEFEHADEWSTIVLDFLRS
jgi:pimeloyl-ACP methyl ester carboxylesterase